MNEEPLTVLEAVSSVDAHRWKEAMDEEYASLTKNQVWRLEVLPSGSKVVSSGKIARR